jgi:hypothetical protein
MQAPPPPSAVADLGVRQAARNLRSFFEPWDIFPHFHEMHEYLLVIWLARALSVEVLPPDRIPIVWSGMNPIRQEAMHVPWQIGDVFLGF